jgi:hypothetical protein
MAVDDFESRLAGAMTQAAKRATCNLAQLPGITHALPKKWVEEQFCEDRMHKVHPLAWWLSLSPEWCNMLMAGLDAAIGSLRASGVEGLPKCLGILRGSRGEFLGMNGQLRLANHLLNEGATVRLEPELPNGKVMDVHAKVHSTKEDVWFEVYTPDELKCAHLLDSAFQAWYGHHQEAGTLTAFRMHLTSPGILEEDLSHFDDLFVAGDEFIRTRPSVTKKEVVWEDPSGVRLAAVPTQWRDAHGRGVWNRLPVLSDNLRRRISNAIRQKVCAGQFATSLGSRNVAAVQWLLTRANTQLAMFGPVFPEPLAWSDWGLPDEIDRVFFFFFYPDTAKEFPFRWMQRAKADDQGDARGSMDSHRR